MLNNCAAPFNLWMQNWVAMDYVIIEVTMPFQRHTVSVKTVALTPATAADFLDRTYLTAFISI